MAARRWSRASISKVAQTPDAQTSDMVAEPVRPPRGANGRQRPRGIAAADSAIGPPPGRCRGRAAGRPGRSRSGAGSAGCRWPRRPGSPGSGSATSTSTTPAARCAARPAGVVPVVGPPGPQHRLLHRVAGVVDRAEHLVAVHQQLRAQVAGAALEVLAHGHPRCASLRLAVPHRVPVCASGCLPVLPDVCLCLTGARTGSGGPDGLNGLADLGGVDIG